MRGGELCLPHGQESKGLRENQIMACLSAGRWRAVKRRCLCEVAGVEEGFCHHPVEIHYIVQGLGSNPLYRNALLIHPAPESSS